MSQSQSGSGLQSSAGLVQYFEQEDKRSITINPKTVIALCMLASIGLMSLHVVLPAPA